MTDPVNADALKSEIRAAVINQKANACPMIVRLAWHASGTYDKADGSGGSNGATMRFKPESDDDANAGLSIARDMLKLVKDRHPEVSYADLWTFAGCAAIEFMGGPKIPHSFGRGDARDGSACPALGRLPDASQGAQHLRDVFHRMGFSDQEIVALSGAHTLGRCHRVRSGYDGPWTRQPLKFDNTYFKNLIHLKWTPKKWDGPLQYEDPTGDLMMLPTDMVLIEDAAFRPWVERYAADQDLFFEHFASAFSKLISLGTHARPSPRPSPTARASADFREAAMHGSEDVVRRLAKDADVHAVEASSGRTALHKAAFWGHVATVDLLVNELRLEKNARDYNGDTALHDAARFGHTDVVKLLLEAHADIHAVNKQGMTALALARQYDKTETAELLAAHTSRL